jgi:hypothetical protein
MVLRVILPPYMCDSQYQIISFVLVRTIRSSFHFMKLPNQINLIASLKVMNLTAVRNRVKVQTIDDSILR